MANDCHAIIAERGACVTSLRDIAAAAGVSTSTVSRALGDSSHPVSARLRERIRRIADEMGYKPNPLARALLAQRLRIIGAMVRDARDSYLAEVVHGMEDVARSAGYMVVICNTLRDMDRELSYVDLLVAHRAAGIVFVSSGVEDAAHNAELTLRLEALRRNGGFAVAAASTRLPIPRVVPDNQEGGRMAAAHLLSLRRRPVLVLGGFEGHCTSTDRLSGYADAFSAAGLSLADEPMVRAGDQWDTAREAVSRELARGTPFRAVLATNDEAAIGALAALKSAGVRVPEDVAVVGFGDMRVTHLVQPKLTTVRVPTYELGRVAVQTVVDALEAGIEPAPIRVLPVELVVRGSTVAESRPTLDATVFSG